MSTQSYRNIQIKTIEPNKSILLKKPIEPPFKWIGGKRRLAKEIIALMPTNYTQFYELFFGAGALTFHLQPKNVVINDYNPELTNLYSIIKDNISELINVLNTYQVSKEFFYTLRNIDRDKELFSKLTNIERASRFFYLTKYSFYSRMSLNKNSELMASINQEAIEKTKLELQYPKLKAISDYFNYNNITILNKDCNIILDNITDKDSIVYLDPPYYLEKEKNGKCNYYSNIFDADSHEVLKSSCDKLTEKGVRFLQSNSNCEFIRELYKDYEISEVGIFNPLNKTHTTEVLIKNY